MWGGGLTVHQSRKETVGGGCEVCVCVWEMGWEGLGGSRKQYFHSHLGGLPPRTWDGGNGRIVTPGALLHLVARLSSHHFTSPPSTPCKPTPPQYPAPLPRPTTPPHHPTPLPHPTTPPRYPAPPPRPTTPLQCFVQSGKTARDTLCAEMAFMFAERNAGRTAIDYPVR